MRLEILAMTENYQKAALRLGKRVARKAGITDGVAALDIRRDKGELIFDFHFANGAARRGPARESKSRAAVSAFRP